MRIATVRSRSALIHDRLDAHFFTSPGVAAMERLAILEASGIKTARIGDMAQVWGPPRFARAWAAPAEPGVPYLRPYDVFEYLPVSSDRLSIGRNSDLEGLQAAPGTLLQTCSGRNLGPVTVADETIARYALSHDIVRIFTEDEEMRMYLLAFLKTPTGQALLRRGRSGSVIDHITVADVKAIPVPLVSKRVQRRVAEHMQRAVRSTSSARSRLTKLLDSLEGMLPNLSDEPPSSRGWTVNSTALAGRVDAAFYDPRVQVARTQAREAGGVPCRELASVFLPSRYKRYYVGAEHGRPILSGRQILQLEPVNLQWVSDRSFREPDKYVISNGMTILAADGRAEGAQGTASLVTVERDGWLASNHVMRLRPRPGVRPGVVWLALASRQAKLQVNALSFGSVVDQLDPGDVENVVVPRVSDEMGLEAEDAWSLFADAVASTTAAVDLLERNVDS